MSEACTIGATRLPGADGYLLFKNKDFRRPRHVDRTVCTSNHYAVRGVATWDVASGQPDDFAGFSIGVNAAGLAACCSNVRSIPGGIPYDCLVEEIVRECETLEQAVRRAELIVERARYVWGNILVATAAQLGVIEVRDQIRIERSYDCVARANHHLLFDDHSLDDDQDTTPNRYAIARRRIASAATVDELVGICRSHDPEPGQLSICRHGPPYYTVASYIIRMSGGHFEWYACESNPCEQDYQEIQISF